jgi:hypothetical protein
VNKEQADRGKYEIQPPPFIRCPGPHFHKETSEYQPFNNETVTMVNKNNHLARSAEKKKTRKLN